MARTFTRTSRTSSGGSTRVTYGRGKGKGGGNGGGGTTTTPTTPSPDTTPDAFAFADVTDAPLSTLVSVSTTITGINAETTVTPGPGLECSFDGSTWFDVPKAMPAPGGVLHARGLTSDKNLTTVTFTVDVGGVSATISIRTKAADPEPAVGIPFGVKTRSGFGNYALADVSITGGSGATDWTTDGTSQVPAGTYGAFKAYTKAAGETYSLTYTGETMYDTTLVAGVAHIAATAADTATSNQLRTMLQLAAGSQGALVLGDTVKGRDGYFNPTSALWRVSLPSGGYSGSGVITIASDNPNEDADEHGLPLRGGGFQLGALTANTSVEAEFPWTFEDVTFTSATNATKTTFLGYNAGSGTGISARRCRFENTDDVAVDYYQNGFQNRGGTAQDCHFRNLFRGSVGGVTDGAASTWDGNVFEGMASDGLTIAGNNLVVTDNFFKNFLFKSGAHPDAIQHQGALTGSLRAFGIIKRNIGVRNMGVSGTGDAQFIFLSDTPSPYWIYDAEIENNIGLLTAGHGITLTRFRDSKVRFNTILPMFGANASKVLTMPIDVSTCEAVTVSQNVAVSFALGTANNASNNVTLGNSQEALAVAFPRLVFGTNPGHHTREDVLYQLTPANLAQGSGGVMLGGNLCAGALFPAVEEGGIGAWNDGTAFAPNDSGWVAAHPPAA